jgi:hypothetical protein
VKVSLYRVKTNAKLESRPFTYPSSVSWLGRLIAPGAVIQPSLSVVHCRVKEVLKMSEMDDLLGRPGESVPMVDVKDMKAMWNYGQEVRALHPGSTHGAVGFNVWKSICGPGSDIAAVGYRLTILTMLAAAWTGGKPSERAFTVAARIDLIWPKIGVVGSGLHFNVERFLVEVMHASDPVEQAI